MEVELPGLTDKDIELKVEDNILTLSSKKEESKEEKKNGYLLRERRSAEFCRTFVLPNDADRAEIKAEFKNGLLEVSVPKKPEAQPRKIDVKVN
jgi:HSP20 family protein